MKYFERIELEQTKLSLVFFKNEMTNLVQNEKDKQYEHDISCSIVLLEKSIESLNQLKPLSNRALIYIQKHNEKIRLIKQFLKIEEAQDDTIQQSFAVQLSKIKEMLLSNEFMLNVSSQEETIKNKDKKICEVALEYLDQSIDCLEKIKIKLTAKEKSIFKKWEKTSDKIGFLFGFSEYDKKFNALLFKQKCNDSASADMKPQLA